MKTQNLKDLLESIAASAAEPRTPEFTLEELFAKMSRLEKFVHGDEVKWKCEQLRPMSLPEEGAKMYVVDVLDIPVIDRTASAGTAAFDMPLNVRVCCLLMPDGDYAEFLVDGRRITRA